MSQRSSSAELAAQSLLEELAIESVDDLMDLELIVWHKKKALIRYTSITNAEGHSIRRKNGAVISVDQNILQEGKRRFVIAHELGHLELHEEGHSNLCSSVDFNDYRNSGRESQANEFAAEFLMPRRFFARSCDVKKPSLNEVKNLSEKFRTTLTATAIRFVQLCPERCAIVASKDGNIVWSRKGPSFYRRIISNGKPTASGSYAFDVFAGKTIPDRQEDVLANQWLDDSRVGPEHYIYEHTVSMPSYRMALSLLWIPPDERDF